MRRLIRNIGVTAVLIALTAVAVPPATGQPDDVPRVAVETAYFEFTDYTRERFVLKLSDQDKIEHARRILSGEATSQVHVHGRIVKRSAPYNSRWSYHLDPETVSFFEVAIEVCDATIPYVEHHLDEAGGAFLPGLHWCPWESRLVRELPEP
ncbi:hypothetical protein [Saccharothrix australiensis]|uniref:BP74 N-terminal domain-containing protein n=1 Tax=Saccharothrix australiensis TaxID=2072 RepID=A0A495W0W4_9PSEU|nr:hypothetical protein [Saccharothrix australiensis]RKT55312.1 hypothetical protein C8E97_3975 [Saccharothrix australiensis]